MTIFLAQENSPKQETTRQEIWPKMVENDAAGVEVIEGIGSRLPIHPFQVLQRTLEPRIGRHFRDTPDAFLTLKWGEQEHRFAVVYKSSSTPKLIDQAAQAARRYARVEPSLAPLVVAPYLRSDVLDHLVDEGVSGIDCSGNYAIVVPNQWLVIRSGERNRFPASTPIKNIYRGRSGLVARALLLYGSFPSATALAANLHDAGPVSLGTVSKVLTVLENDLLIDRADDIRVVQPGLLLDRLTAAYQPPHVRRRVTGRPPDANRVAELLRRNERDHHVRYVYDVHAHYILQTMSLTRVYVESIESIIADLQLDVRSGFPSFEFLEVHDPGVYYGRRPGQLYDATSPLQVYLELMAGGKRDQEAARELRSDLLSGKYR
jgi:hypothetical protein